MTLLPSSAPTSAIAGLSLFSLDPDKPRKPPDKPRKPPDKPRKLPDKPRKPRESLF